VSPDELAIISVFSRAARFGDDGERDRKLELFADDMVFEYPPNPPLIGKQAYADWYETYRDKVLPGRHLTANHVIDVAPDGLTAEATADLFFVELDTVLIRSISRYFTSFRKDNDRWLITRHRIEVYKFRSGIDHPLAATSG
jgi:ketosteroid isomerase-like protein